MTKFGSFPTEDWKPRSGCFYPHGSQRRRIFGWARILTSKNDGEEWNWDKWEDRIESLVRDLKRNGINP